MADKYKPKTRRPSSKDAKMPSAGGTFTLNEVESFANDALNHLGWSTITDPSEQRRVQDFCRVQYENRDHESTASVKNEFCRALLRRVSKDIVTQTRRARTK